MRTSALLAIALVPALARADCPTDAREGPPLGAPGLGVPRAAAYDATTTRDVPRELHMTIAAAGVVRVDDTELVTGDATATGGAGSTSPADGVDGARTAGDGVGTGSVGGMVEGRLGDFGACVSGDLLDVRSGAAHLSAFGQIPVLFGPVRVGAIVDRDVRLALAARPELYRGPVSRAAVVVSFALADVGMSDRTGSFRFAVFPVRVEKATASQTEQLDRQATDVSASVFDIRSTSESGDVQVRAVSFDLSWTRARRAPDTEPPNGFARFSLVGLTFDDHVRVRADLDAGMLLLTDTDASIEHGDRYWWLGDVRYKLATHTLGARLERSPFITADNEPAYEDRMTANAATTLASFDLSASGFAAIAQRWVTDGYAVRAGLGAHVSRDLGHGFSAMLDGELVGVLDSSAMAGLGEDGARMLASLAWSTSYQRRSQGPAPPDRTARR